MTFYHIFICYWLEANHSFPLTLKRKRLYIGIKIYYNNPSTFILEKITEMSVHINIRQIKKRKINFDGTYKFLSLWWVVSKESNFLQKTEEKAIYILWKMLPLMQNKILKVLYKLENIIENFQISHLSNKQQHNL